MLHSPTIKPWNRQTTNQWKSENWLDISIWCELAFEMSQEFEGTKESFKDFEWILEARCESFEGENPEQM